MDIELCFCILAASPLTTNFLNGGSDILRHRAPTGCLRLVSFPVFPGLNQYPSKYRRHGGGDIRFRVVPDYDTLGRAGPQPLSPRAPDLQLNGRMVKWLKLDVSNILGVAPRIHQEESETKVFNRGRFGSKTVQTARMLFGLKDAAMIKVLARVMTGFFSFSIRVQLVFIVLIIALPAAGMIIYSGVRLRDEAVKIAIMDSQRLADSMALQQQNTVAAAQQLVSALAQLPEVKRHDRAKVEPLLMDILKLNSQYSNIAIIGGTGRVWVSSVQALLNRDVSDRRYFKNPMATGRFSSGEYIVSRAIFKPVINFGYPLKNERGETDGVISIGYDLGYYRKLFDGAKLPHGSNYLLIDHKGVMLSGAMDNTGYLGKKFDPQQLKQMQDGPEEGNSTGTLLSDGEHFISFRKMLLKGEPTPYMYIRVGIPTEVVLSNANGMLWSNLVLFMSCLLLALCVAWLIGKRSIADRISLLKKASQLLAKGNLDARISTLVAGGELGSLGESFDSIAKELALGEQARLVSERNYREIFNASKDAIILHNKQTGRILEANDAVKQMYGYSREEMLELAMQDISFDGSPCLSREAANDDADSLQGATRSFEWQCRRKNGESFWTEVVLSTTSIGGEGCLLAVVRDITERNEAELEKKLLKDQLSQVQKIESIGRLAGGIAHDLNNLLTPIMGYSQLLQKRSPREDKSYYMAGQISQAGDKAQILVQQLLSFSRKQRLDMKVVNLNEVVSSFYGILRRTIRESIEIQLKPAVENYNIRADANQIEQIIMNLAVNAQDAIGGKGTITIETASMVLDEEYARHHSSVKPGRYYMLAVTDNGCGMDHETMEHVFEPFFTTKPVGRGTGLGLATVYGLVKQHEGSIWVYSEPGKGCAFKVFFPIVDEEAVAEEPVDLPQVEFSADKYTILLVEDNNLLRCMVRDLLANYGFDVIEAEGPEKALEMVEGRSIDLLVTDVVMPGLSGPELHERLLEKYPGLIVLFMSGYTNNVVMNHGVTGCAVNFIQKPFSVDSFLLKVKGLLNSSVAAAPPA
jgi:two-component system, cell cycle sensor histidine kinase and response regulator CckA